MVDTNKIAITDLLFHPVHGVISHQPDLTEPISDTIRIRNQKGIVYYVLASECRHLEGDEGKYYWRDFPREEER